MPEMMLGLVQDSPGENPRAEGRRIDRRNEAEAQALNRIRRLLELVRGWALENEGRVKKVYLTIGNEFNLYVVSRTREYDFELTKALSVLLISLTDEGFAVHGAQVPDGPREELQAYFDPEEALVLSLQ
jgi:hypothetical protein